MAENADRSTEIRVLVVDDHPIMRAGLAQLIRQEPDMTVCGEASDGDEALGGVAQSDPAVVLVDLSLRDSSGLDLIQALRAQYAHLPVLVVSMHDEQFYAERALRAGARGYVTKSEPPMRIIEGIRAVLAGGVFVSQDLASRMLGSFIGAPEAGGSSPLNRLSDREFQVFELIGQGLQNRQIAKRLHVSVKTVEAHREHIKKKLQIDNAPELLRYAMQWTELDRDG